MIADGTARPALHAADCGIWDIPSTGDVDRLVVETGRDDAAALYLSTIAPLYHSLAQVLAQLSGVLLLALTSKRRGIPLDHPAWQDARRRLTEALQRLKSLKVPSAAAAHFGAIGEIVHHLCAAAAAVEAAAVTLPEITRAAHLKQGVGRLQAAQRLLVSAAVPDANITPVDLTHACCSCGAASRTT